MSDTKSQPDPRRKSIEENGNSFPLLTLSQLDKIEQWIVSDITQHHLNLANLAGVSPAEKYGLLSASIPKYIDLDHIAEWLGSARNIRRVLIESVGDKPEVIEPYTGGDGGNLAMALMGYCTRMTPDELMKRQQELADRINGLYQAERAYEARKAQLEAKESGKAQEESAKGSFPPGGGVTG